MTANPVTAVLDRAAHDQRTNGLSHVSDVTLDWLRAAERAVNELPRPVVVDATGEDTWTITAPGFGEPRFYRVEFDHDADLRYQTEQWGEYAAALEALRGRIAPDVFAYMAEGVDDERERLRDYIGTMDATLDELEVSPEWDTVPTDDDR